MPADLDDLFDALGRNADALPLPGAADARRRGRQRIWTQATVAAAAAVVLVLAGIGVALRDPHPRASRPATTPSPTVFTTGVPIVGTVSLSTSHLAAGLTAQDGRRAYATWVNRDDNKQWVIAADLTTGAQAWPSREIVDPDRSIEQILAVPSAVLVINRTHSGAAPERALYAFDPATGAPLWQDYLPQGDSIVYTDRAVVRSTRQGSVEGLDWRTGKARWTVTMEHDRPLRTIGMRTAADEERIDQAGARPDLTDGRVAVITVAGQVRVLDSGTGQVSATASVPVGSGETMVAYDGRLFSHDEADDNGGPHHIRATDLTGGGGSAIVGTVPDRFRSMQGCGPNRVCVVTSRKPKYEKTVLTAFDVAKRKLLWETAVQNGGDEISSARSRTMVSSLGYVELFDANGTRIFTSPLVAGWLDAGTLLIHAPDGTARWSRWSVADHKLTPLGAPPREMLGLCASTSTRLACPAESGLRVWQVG